MDYNILGLYTHGKKDFNLTFQQFFRSCLKDDALYDALKLKEEWPTIPTILAVNEVETASVEIEINIEVQCNLVMYH